MLAATQTLKPLKNNERSILNQAATKLYFGLADEDFNLILKHYQKKEADIITRIVRSVGKALAFGCFKVGNLSLQKPLKVQLSTRTYIVNDSVKLEEFLEYELRKRAGSCNIYDSYSNIARHYIIPKLGKKKLTEIQKGDVQRLYQDRTAYSKSIASQTKVVMNVSFRFAVSSGLLAVNLAKGISLPKNIEPKLYHTRNIDTTKTLNMEQIQRLLKMSESTPIHMQVLFNVLVGLRRQEINAVQYSDVDYINRTLSVERQLGKELNREPYAVDEHATMKSELCLKTSSSRRVLPIPDYVFEAILQERKRYEKNRSRHGKRFLDTDYICCSNYGKPRSKDFHWRHYKKLLQDVGLPDIRWHDLRSSY